MYFLLLFVQVLTAWEHELTTDVIQRYNAPNSLVREVENINVNFFNPYKICRNFVLKHNASRIIGARRLKNVFAEFGYADLNVPEKFLIPVFNCYQQIDVNASKVISMHVHGMYPRNLSDERVKQLINLTSTGVGDFADRNMLLDEDKSLWFIDTEISKFRNVKKHFIECIVLVDEETFNLSSQMRVDLYSSLKKKN